jgi:long-chain acyl-CoA synthetase
LNLAHLLQRQARMDPLRPAILNGTQTVATYGQWAQRCQQLAAQFQAAGLQPGDRVALFMRNHVRYLEVLFAAWWAGLAVVPINAKLHVREAQWIIDNAQARWAFVTADITSDTGDKLTGLERVIEVDSTEADALWHLPSRPLDTPITERSAHDLAWLFYTSGTTGRPKGVMITHRNLMTMGLGYFCDVDAVAAHNTIAYAAPMSHGAGIYAIPHLMAGARHMVPPSGGFEPAELFALGQQVGPLSMFAAPTIVKRLVDHAEAEGLSVQACGQSFKTVVYGGAPMYAADIQRALRVMGPRFVQIYGQGESPMVGTALSRHHLQDTQHPRHLERLASIGVAQTPVSLSLIHI